MGEHNRRLGRQRKENQLVLRRLYGTCAVSAHAPKTAALIFEKIHSSMDLIGDAPLELITYSGRKGSAGLHEGVAQITRQTDGYDLVTHQSGAQLAVAGGGPMEKERQAQVKVRQDGFVLAPTRESLAYVLATEPDKLCSNIRGTGLRPVLCYPSGDGPEAFQAGDYSFLVACIANLRVVDESQLTWPQVTEFRKDLESRASLARFMYWLDNDMSGKSKAQIEDELCRLYDQSQHALKKFGIYANAVAEAFFAIGEDRLQKIGIGLGALTAGAATMTGAGAVLWSTLFAGLALSQSVWVSVRKARATLAKESDATAFIYGLSEKLGPGATELVAGVTSTGWRYSSDDKWTF